MNYKQVGYIISLLLLLEAGFMVVCLGFSCFMAEQAAIHGYIVSIAIIAAAAGILYLICRDRTGGFYAKEGMVLTGLAWIVISMLGALPFYISGQIPRYVDALFEVVSGFTTTGSSILSNVEGLDKGLLLWRSFTHWVGGMGVLVFLMAIVPLSGKNGGFTLHILRAESPGPSVGKLVPKMKKTASILYLLYIILTVLNLIFLLIGGMPLFDAICTAFGTAGTGGFGIKNDSLAGYSPYLQTVTTVFMLLFGVNFSCYYLLILKSFKEVFRDEELRLYCVIVFSSIALIAWNIRGLYANIGDAIHHSAFQVASIISTSGFATANFDLWPNFSKAILMLLMICGACAGSTGGGIKTIRLLLLFKTLKRNVHQQIHPNRISHIRVNGAVIDEKIITNVSVYLIAYTLIIIASFLIVSLDGFSVEANITAVLATFNNIGPGLAEVGPTCNFYAYSTLSKLVMIFGMLAGRLEIMPVIVLLSRQTWRKV
ncbi:MAG TPA: potassium transporter KefA [Erysipelotrichaceae bacterium]|nr:potassium transporter KefA [Erysipelotrichaceae bacterium]